VRHFIFAAELDDLEFFFDTESEDVVFCAHTDTVTSLKKCQSVIPSGREGPLKSSRTLVRSFACAQDDKR
jgi:hypothetical protein